MYLTQSNVIRSLSKEEYAMLREMCQYSNNLYNVALYNIRQYYFQEKKFLKYEENYHVCKENENYGLNTGTAFIMDGRKLKSINQYWNKQKAYYQGIADKQGQKKTSRLYALARKRNNRTQDYLRKVARYIINYCIEHHIGTIVCGYNGDFKRSIDLSRITNQQFTQISFGNLRETLEGRCERYGMRYIEQEESYTSQASCLDLDDIPVYNPEQPYTGMFSGKRIHRGLYQFADGRIANADVNGAYNILRKSKQNFDFEGLCKGLLDSPLRIRIS